MFLGGVGRDGGCGPDNDVETGETGMSEEQDRPDGHDIRPSDMLSRTESVVHSEIDGVIVMLDSDAGRYYELDEVGKRVWNLIETDVPVASVRDTLVTEYAVDAQTCLTDLLAFVETMADHGLVRIRCADGRGRAG